MASLSNSHGSTRHAVQVHTPVSMYFKVIGETIIAALTLMLIAGGIFLFISGTQLMQSNIMRSGVRLSQVTHNETTQIYGTFTARSDCTRVDVTTEDSATERALYLTETERGNCELYVNPLPYTFTAVFDGVLSGPIAVYMNGERISTINE